MGWDMSDQEEGFLDDFDAECVEAGFVTGFIPAESTKSGKAVETQQLLVLWKPLDTEEKQLQPAWYSMGQKGFKFGGTTKTLKVGSKDAEFTLHGIVEEGSPRLNKQAKLAKLINRLAGLGEAIAGNAAVQFIGIRAHLLREEYEATGQFAAGEKKTLMPQSLLGEKVSADQAVLEYAIGKDEAIFARQLRTDAVLSKLGIDTNTAFSILDGLVTAGKLELSDGKYKPKG